jgi:tetratricopeptide (TPR) repeat protein
VEQIGPYTIEAELGRGGAGVVYRARDPRTGERVAIKVLLGQGGGASETARRRFSREVDALRRLDHPGVVRVRDAGQERGRPYLVLDFVEGRSLQERLDREGSLPPREAASVALALAEAVQHAHEQGVVHRDLKPDNVLLEADGTPRLTDFGLMRDLDLERSRLTHTGTFLGTPGFWAPEQARGDRAAMGPGSDVYGLGATLYAMLTGGAPHVAGSLIELLVHMERDPAPPSRLAKGLDAALDAICVRCLAREPARRYVTAGALASALRTYLETEPAVRPPALGAPTSALAGAVVVLLAVVGALAWSLVPVDPRVPAEDVVGSPVEPTQPVEPAEPPTVESAEPPPVEPVEPQPLDPHMGSTPAARRAFDRGMGLDGAGDTAGAKRAYDRALELAPDYARALGQRGRARRILGEYPGAIDDLTHAVELDPVGLPDAWIERGYARVQAGDVSGGIEDCTRAIAVAPDYWRGYHERGLWRSQAGEVDGMVEDFDAAGERGLPSAQLVRLEVGLLVSARRYETALRGVERGLDMDPEVPSLWLYRAQCRLELGDRPGGLADLRVTRWLLPVGDQTLLQVVATIGQLEANPPGRSPGDPLVEVAAVKRRVGGLEAHPRAVSALLDRGLELAPDDPELVGLRGRLRLAGGDLVGAQADLATLVDLTPESLEAWLDLGTALGKQELYALADAACTQALGVDPDSFRALYDRATWRELAGNHEGALADYDRVLVLEPSHVAARRERAGALIFLRRFEEGLAELSRALELDPHDGDTWAARGAQRYQRGDYAGCADDLGRALELLPADGSDRAGLEMIRADAQRRATQ